MGFRMLAQTAQPGPQQGRPVAVGEFLMCVRKTGLVGALLKGRGPETWPVLPFVGLHKPEFAQRTVVRWKYGKILVCWMLRGSWVVGVGVGELAVKVIAK